MVFENLNIKALQKRHGRKILDLSFSNFLRILKNYEYKNGSKIIYVDRFYPSSKICCRCKKINENLNLKDRRWTCPHCKRKIMRDKNAAKNIKRQGIVLWHRERKTLKTRAIPAENQNPPSFSRGSMSSDFYIPRFSRFIYFFY